VELEYSRHARDMIAERGIAEEWIRRCPESPDSVGTGADGNLHYLKAIEEHNGRFLRVVVNSNRQPNRVVTLFFDRRVGRK
jgi:hypothetical protein